MPDKVEHSILLCFTKLINQLYKKYVKSEILFLIEMWKYVYRMNIYDGRINAIFIQLIIFDADISHYIIIHLHTRY